MKLHTLKKNPLITGTIILTATGLFSKSIGFFYRIFLSNTIGEEGMGLYQLVFPAIGVCMAVCAMSFQTAISRFVAAEQAAGTGNRGQLTLRAGMVLSVLLSLGFTFLLYMLAAPICTYILLEERCEPLLKVACLSLPFATIHSCLSGYYYGRKKASIPALAQVVEQLVRVTTVFIIWNIGMEKGIPLTPLGVMAGMTIGEAVSALFIGIMYLMKESVRKAEPSPLLPIMKNLTSMAVPLSANRFILSVLQSAEAVLIPSRLQLFGMTNSQALSVYGVLTGMAMPFILFPSTLTNSISVMLLPIVAEAQSADNSGQISRASSLNIRFCLWLGILFTAIFILFGNDMGMAIFQSEMAGRYLTILSWLCPFLYLSSTTSSILNGLGKTKAVFFHNVISMGVRLLFIIFLVPIFGITAYLWGTLFSQLLLTLLHMISLFMISPFSFSAFRDLLYPSLFAVLAGAAAKGLKYLADTYLPGFSLITLVLALVFMAVTFYLMTAFRLREDFSPIK